MKLQAIAILFALSILDAVAQPSAPTESVIVTGERVRDEQIKQFVESVAAPTFHTGKIARWEVGICPVTIGLRGEAAMFVTQRIRDLADRVGVPQGAQKSCEPNIEVVFTATPQALLDGVLRDHQAYLGYHDNAQQAAELAKFSHPIESRYATQTVDVNNVTKLDSGGPGLQTGMRRTLFSNSDGTGQLRDGHRSTLHHVIIVANPQQLASQEIGALADYIAFLALAQPRSLDDCAPLPSILNLLAPGCTGAGATQKISEGDIGYLRGVYKMTDDGSFHGQQDEIAFQMKQTFGGR